jgi:hypothetical protein
MRDITNWPEAGEPMGKFNYTIQGTTAYIIGYNNHICH